MENDVMKSVTENTEEVLENNTTSSNILKNSALAATVGVGAVLAWEGGKRVYRWLKKKIKEKRAKKKEKNNEGSNEPLEASEIKDA